MANEQKYGISQMDVILYIVKYKIKLQYGNELGRLTRNEINNENNWEATKQLIDSGEMQRTPPVEGIDNQRVRIVNTIFYPLYLLARLLLKIGVFKRTSLNNEDDKKL